MLCAAAAVNGPCTTFGHPTWPCHAEKKSGEPDGAIAKAKADKKEKDAEKAEKPAAKGKVCAPAASPPVLHPAYLPGQLCGSTHQLLSVAGQPCSCTYCEP